MMSNYYLLLITRFCFGAGEAGAFPNASIVVARWFPQTQRASMSGVLLMASQTGRSRCTAAGRPDSDPLRMAGLLLSSSAWLA